MTLRFDMFWLSIRDDFTLWRSSPYSQEFIHPLILSPTLHRKKLKKIQKNRVCFPSCSSWNIIAALAKQSNEQPFKHLFSLLLTRKWECFTSCFCRDQTSLCSRTKSQLLSLSEVIIRWWVGIDKLGWNEAQGCPIPTFGSTICDWFKQVKRQFSGTYVPTPLLQV